VCIAFMPTSASGVQVIDDVLGRTGLTQPGKDPLHTVVVVLRTQVSHGTDCERDVESEFVCLTRRGLDAGTGSDAVASMNS
jgi:hypothetical protein